MKDRSQQRIVALQKQISIARKALLRIREYGRYPHAVAGQALSEMDAVEYASKPDHSDIHETRFKGLKQ